jgi:hypothetical protein
LSDVDKLKDQLIYEIEKAFYDERGKGARYRLTTAGVSFFEDRISQMDDIDAISDYMKEAGLVQDLLWEEEAVTFNLKVRSCCFYGICSIFTEDNRQPLACPVANVFMNALELKTDLSPEMMPLTLLEGTCAVPLAKIATSDVVGG